MNTRYFTGLINDLSQRSTSGVMSWLNVSNMPLRQHLFELFNRPYGADGSFIASPTFEPVFGWRPCQQTMEELSEGLLSKKLVDALDKPYITEEKQQKIETLKASLRQKDLTEVKRKELEDAINDILNEYSFSLNRKPYQHQLESWQVLGASKAKSLVVTSGTGSGKTECFMIPILDSLVRQCEQEKQQLVGVQALFLYPLNALINSQKDRLLAWTGNFERNVRFCLFNGNTPEQPERGGNKNLSEVADRKTLRESPPPILVTNATMLEYMLVRNDDRPIIEKSRGKLKWIVLDEAHSYVGSQAAELSLLIRRVIHAFDVEPSEVRFIATSATIGDPEGEAGQSLRQFLADVGGIDISQVELRYGVREVPAIAEPQNNLPKSLNELESCDGHEAIYDELLQHPTAYKIRKQFAPTEKRGTSSPTQTLDIGHVCIQLFGKKEQYTLAEQTQALQWLDVLASAKDNNGAAYLPLRAHIYHQTMTGLWACADPNCSEKHHHSPKLNHKDWHYGEVYLSPRNHCLCGAPVYELIFCDDCGEVYLNAQENEVELTPYEDKQNVDEFELEREGDDDEGAEEDHAGKATRLLITNFPFQDAAIATESINKNTRKFCEPNHPDALTVQITPSSDVLECPSCTAILNGKQSKIKNGRVGTPYLLGGILPTLLEYAPDGQDDPINKPYRGRRLLTFNDSRQGTARIAIKLQQDSERAKVRSWIFHQVNKLGDQTVNDPKISFLISLYNSESTPQKDKLEIEKLLRGNVNKGITFDELKKRICGQGFDFMRLLDLYEKHAPDVFSSGIGADNLAEMLIFRELARRPKKSNNLETLGLISLTYPQLQKINSVPETWSEFGLTIEDWRDFLKICIDFFVRAGGSLDIENRKWRQWLSVKIPVTKLIKADKQPAIKQRRWPSVKKSNSRSILVSLLSVVTNLDAKTPTGEDMLDKILEKAWNDLIGLNDLFVNVDGGYNLKLESISFSVPKQLWICPYTRRFLDVSLNGFSPYTPIKNRERVKCEKVDAPIFPKEFDLSEDGFMAKARSWILDSEKIQELRQQALWSTYADQVLESAPFYKTAEHSAQQKSETLNEYEKHFKSGELNILSCSTTMEMGIDIGGIQLVAMNNVPPHPANYLQRAGRAGRRSETKSAAVTLCKANPHDQHVFKNSNWAFGSKFPTPKVSLSSDLIIQRHINSYLLGMFLNGNTDSALKLTSGDFFIDEEGPWKKFVELLEVIDFRTNKEAIEKAIKKLIKNSPYEHQSYKAYTARSAEMIHKIRELWSTEWLALDEELKKVQAKDSDPASKALKYRIERHEMEYLFRDLANFGFLPGYGFPTSLITFNNLKPKQKYENSSKQREDNRRSRAELPTRDIVTALREYAPGSDLVMDGVVYKSAGITLNWKVPASELEAKNELQLIKFFWKCQKCGASAVTAARPNKCAHCQADLENTSEYIEPAGFSVDFYELVTNDITKQKFIKPQSPTLSIHGEWSPLKNPNLGRYRASDTGKMFYQSKGENGTGYALCLGCGRAEPMTKDGEYPEKLNPKKEHNRLIAKNNKSDLRCHGSDNSWLIKKSISFGFETFTDIFEIQLKDLNREWLNDSTLANTVSVAMRNALAEELGIQASELGAAVQKIKTEDGNYAQSIFIYDENNAGYTSNIDHLINPLLEKTLEQLDCSRGCDSACPSCLLDFEHRHEFDKLNRISAQKFLTRDWLNSLVIPKEISYFGDSSEVEVKTLAEAIFSAGKRPNVTQINMCLGESSDEADFAMADFRKLAYDLAIVSKKKVNLILKESALKNYQQEELVTLRSLVDHEEINALTVQEMPKAKNGNVIAEVVFQNGDYWAWALSDVAFMNANEMWGKCTPIVRGKSKSTHIENPRTVNKTEIQLPVGDQEILVKNQLDGKLLGFGSRFWQYLSKEHGELNKLLQSYEVDSIEYSDKYIFTPIAIGLLKEIVVGLRESVGFDHWKSVNLVVHTVEKRAYSEYKVPQGMIYSDWLNSQERNQVLINVFKEVGVDATVKATQQHSRSLSVHFKNNTTLAIKLDKGVSYWRVNNKLNRYSTNNRFDFSADEMQQARNILNLRDTLVEGETLPTELFLKIRNAEKS